MGKSESHGTRGKLLLNHTWEESDSTHQEHYDDLYLEASPDEQSVMLVHAQGTKRYIKRLDKEHSEEKIEISVSKLVELIRQHGRKI